MAVTKPQLTIEDRNAKGGLHKPYNLTKIKVQVEPFQRQVNLEENVYVVNAVTALTFINVCGAHFLSASLAKKNAKKQQK